MKEKMMEERIFQVLQDELQAMAELHKQFAEHTLLVSKLAGKLVPSEIHVADPHWELPEKDYGRLVDFANAYKPKWKTESWPGYAVRLAKLAGWDVDYRTLRRCVERKNED